jgi:hypothetical protein
MGCKVMDWVYLMQIKIQWYAFVNMIIVIGLNVWYTYFIFFFFWLVLQKFCCKQDEMYLWNSEWKYVGYLRGTLHGS